MLKGISPLLPPDLLKILMEMGHGDELVIADGNFPAASHAQRLVRCDGHPAPPVLDAVLQLLPLDIFVPQPVALMAVSPGDNYQPVIWPIYQGIVRKHAPNCPAFEQMERHAFYERARKAHAIVATGELALYANLILKKGIIT
jgi:L-fucose mutarotase